MKRILSLTIVLAMLLTSFAFAKPVSKETKKTTQPVLLNGKEVELGAYLIEGRNYVKLRDIAALLTETDAKFNVGFDNDKKIVLIKTGEAYEKQENDLKDLPDGTQEAVISERPFMFNGKEKMVETAVVNKNNFLQLRQLGELIGFGVNYDKKTSAIQLTTVAKKEKPEPKLEDQKPIDINDFKGEWISIHTLLGQMKKFVKSQSESLKVSEKEVIEKFEKKWAFSAKSLVFDGNKVTFKMNDGKEFTAEYNHAGFVPRIKNGRIISYQHLFATESKDAPKYFITTNIHSGHAHLFYLGNDKLEKLEGEMPIATIYPTTTSVEEIDEIFAEYMGGHSKKGH